jgi:hypothetical protein
MSGPEDEEEVSAWFWFWLFFLWCGSARWCCSVVQRGVRADSRSAPARPPLEGPSRISQRHWRDQGRVAHLPCSHRSWSFAILELGGTVRHRRESSVHPRVLLNRIGLQQGRRLWRALCAATFWISAPVSFHVLALAIQPPSASDECSALLVILWRSPRLPFTGHHGLAIHQCQRSRLEPHLDQHGLQGAVMYLCSYPPTEPSSRQLGYFQAYLHSHARLSSTSSYTLGTGLHPPPKL